MDLMDSSKGRWIITQTQIQSKDYFKDKFNTTLH
jgi:hypothetical protein